MGTEINELYNALQRFIERRQKMHIPLEQDDDDVIIANAFDELEQLRTENKQLREIVNRRIKALNELLVCYRIGRQPSEKLFWELEVTEKKWSKLEGGGSDG